MALFLHIFDRPARATGQPGKRRCSPYVLNRYSHIPGTQPPEYESRIPTGELCIRHEHVHIQGYCIHETGLRWIEYRGWFFALHIQHVGAVTYK